MARKLSSPSPQIGAVRKSRNGIRGRRPASDRAVVVTVKVALEEFGQFSLTGVGEKEQLDAGGAPLQASDKAPLNPAMGVRESVKVAVSPAVSPNPAGEAEREKSARATASASEALS